VWIPKKKWEALEKRIADLEKIARNQQKEIVFQKYLYRSLKKDLQAGNGYKKRGEEYAAGFCDKESAPRT
jgi:hypothetical protein